MQKNQIQVQQNNQVVANLSVPQQLMVSIAQNYCDLFPNFDVENSKKLALQFANKLVDVKTKSGQPAYQVCTADSIKQTFFEVLDKNIDLSKSQGALIAYGDKLQLQLEYFGNVKQAKQEIPNLVDIRGTIIYKGDEINVSVNNGLYKIENHKTNFLNMRDENIIGAYSIAIYRDENGKEYQGEVEIMNAQELKNSWLQSRNGTSVHSKFGHEMARKTVESRNAKHLLNKLATSKFSFNTDDVEEETTPQNVIDVKEIIEQEEKVVEQKVENEPIKQEEIVIEVATEEPKNSFEGFRTFQQPIVEEPQPINDIPQAPSFADLNSIGNIFNNTLPNNNFQQPVPETPQNNVPNAPMGEKIVVSYSDWKNIYQPTGEWKLEKYDQTTKSASITKIK